MTDQGTPPQDGGSATPSVLSAEPSRVIALADWLARNRESFTEAALERSALQGGYTADEYAQAARLATQPADDAALGTIKSSARRYVLAAYGIVWLLFAIVYLLRPLPTSGEGTSIGYGPFLQVVLTFSLLIGLGISLLVIRAGHPDPGKRARAMVLLLAVPVILLIGVAGTCLPFVPSA